MKTYYNYKNYIIFNTYYDRGCKKIKNNRVYEIYYNSKFIKQFFTLRDAKHYINTRDYNIDLFYLN